MRGVRSELDLLAGPVAELDARAVSAAATRLAARTQIEPAQLTREAHVGALEPEPGDLAMEHRRIDQRIVGQPRGTSDRHVRS